MTTAPLAIESGPTVNWGVCDDTGPVCPLWAGRFEIVERIGHGGMGVVYRARDTQLPRELAIKVIHDGRENSSSRRQMRSEATALALLKHPNVIPILDIYETEDTMFVTMPLVENGTLRHWLRTPRSLHEILDAFIAAGRGLAATHAAELVHRDFKPDNVLLGASGEIYVADFGLAKFFGPQAASALPHDMQSQSSMVAGTPVYMPPEQLRAGPIDARADQFSFCVALWEGVYGERPFPDPDRSADDPLHNRCDVIATGPRKPRRTDRPAWIAWLLTRGLAADREQRWPSMQALLDAIAARRTRRHRWRRLAIGLCALGIVVAVAVATLVVTALVPVERPAPPPPHVYLHIDKLQAAAISANGTTFVISGDTLVSQYRGRELVLVEHGMRPPIAVSPDGEHILVGTEAAFGPTRKIAWLDVATGQLVTLPLTGEASFASNRDIVVTDIRRRTVAVVPIDRPTTVTRTCEVPGDYTFLWHPSGLPDGTIIVQAQYVERGSHSLVVLDPDCRQTPMPVESITDYALTDTGGLVVLVPGDRFDEIVELSLAGKVVSRRRVTGSIGGVFGRRAGVDYVTMHTAKTELVRIQDGAPQRLLPLAYDASLYPSPSGNALVWIQHDRRPQLSGPLWVSTLQNPTRSATRLDNATTAGWSPSGRMLAVLVDEAPAKPRRWLVGLDANLKELHRIPVNEVDPEAAPVWLDEHRVAVRSADRKRYRWYDLTSNAQGEIGDDHHGSTLWLTRSPDGTLAMWRMGPPGAIDARTEHLWIERPGGALLPLHVDDAVKHFLVPSWSRSGELLVRSLQTGVVSQVALDTGVATQIAQLPETPLSQLYDDHLVALDNGDLLAVNHEIGADVAMVGPEP